MGILALFSRSYDEFVGEKVVSPSSSSAILGLPPVFWILEVFRFSLMTMMLEVDFSYMTFIVLQPLPSISTLLSIFVMKGY